MKRVYVAGPIAKGHPFDNIPNAAKAGNALLAAGHAPFVPAAHNFLLGMQERWNDATWLGMDFAWLRVSEAVLRLPGESRGADMEVAEAKRLGIPVFTDLVALENWASSIEVKGDN